MGNQNIGLAYLCVREIDFSFDKVQYIRSVNFSPKYI